MNSMTPENKIEIQRKMKLISLSRIFSFIIGLIGIAAICGWIFDINFLKSIFPNFITMKVNTAFCFILISISLLIFQKFSTAKNHVIIYLAKFLAVIVFLIGFLTLIEFMFHLDLHIDQLLLNQSNDISHYYLSGRMSPITAVIFILTGFSLFLVDIKKSLILMQSLALAISFLALFVVTGLVYHINMHYEIAFSAYSSIHATFNFFLISLAILFMKPDQGIMRVFISDTIGGRLINRLLPALIFFLIFFGYLRIIGEFNKLYDTQSGVALFSTVDIGIVFIIILYAATKLMKFDYNRKKIENELAASETRWREASLYTRTLIEASLDPLVTISKYGKISDVNKATEMAIGIPREKLIGKDFSIYFTDPEMAKKGFAETFKTGFTRDFPLAFKNPAGEIRNVICNAVLYKDLNGNIAGLFAAARDITERKKSEEKMIQYASELEKLQNELLLLNNDLEEQAFFLKQVNRAKSVFLANMSHELRTPLNSIIGFTEMMYKGIAGPVNPQHKEYLKEVVTSAQHLLHLINDLLDLSKIEAEKMEQRPVPCFLNKILQDVTQSMSLFISEKKMKYETYIDPTLMEEVMIDPDRLKQILYNYLSNAVKFTPPCGNITVKIIPENENFFRIDVSDTGIGISKNDMGKLFSMFTQLNVSYSKQYQGIGLGLALTRKLVEMMHGRVDVVSELGKGSTFSAILPLIKSNKSNIK